MSGDNITCCLQQKKLCLSKTHSCANDSQQTILSFVLNVKYKQLFQFQLRLVIGVALVTKGTQGDGSLQIGPEAGRRTP